jgi:uncharacterized membrane protein
VLRRWWLRDADLSLALLFWTAGMILIALISFPNHYTFRTAALDLGYVLAMIEYVMRGHFFVLVYGWDIPHFTHLMYITAIPFYLVGKAWGVLVHQWLSMGLGAWGLYMFAKRKLSKGAPWVLIHFFGMWGVHGAMGFDAHPELLGLCMIPWIFYAIDANKPYLFIISWIFLAFSKEQHTIMSFFLLFGLWYLYRKSPFPKKFLWFALGISTLCIILFVLMVAWLESKYKVQSIPNMLYRHLWSDNPFNPTSYAEGFFQKMKQLIKNARYLWPMLWESQIPDPDLRGIKSEVHLSVLLTGGWTFFAYPIFAFMLLPTYMYKMYADSANRWSILAHYNMEFAVIIPIAVVWFMSHRGRRYAGWGMPVIAIFTQIYNHVLFRNTFAFFVSPERQYWYDYIHYCNPLYDYEAITSALKQIPDTATVSTTTRLNPHFSRDPRLLYWFPDVRGSHNRPAQYIALLREDDFTPPLDREAYNAYIDSLTHSPAWEVIHDKDYLLILKSRPPN